MVSMLLDEKELEECVKQARDVEDKLKKITNEARLRKLAWKRKYKKKARRDEKTVAVKRKYTKLRRDLFDKRNEHIESIPGFWKTAFLNHTCLRKHLTNQDAKIIESLKSVDVEDDESERKITLLFDENQYFKNSLLTKTYSYTDKGGLDHKSGTKILWKDTTNGSENETPGSLHPPTDIEKSFFTQLFYPQHNDLPKKPRDEVLEAIVENLWCSPLVYFLNWCGTTAAMGVDEENKKRIALDAIEIIQDNLGDVRGNKYRECIAVEREFEKKARVHQVGIEQKCNQERKPLYHQRNEIFKAIPNFWLFAFLSHHALGDLFREEDQKIFRFVDSMDVEDEEDVVSGYTITLNFNDNPYFTNSSLTKRISFCVDGTTDLSAVQIEWKDGMAITTEYLHDTADFDTGFFTWFCAPQVIREGYKCRDEVSEVIKDELWPNALEYFVNGNESDEEDEPPKRRRGMTRLASF